MTAPAGAPPLRVDVTLDEIEAGLKTDAEKKKTDDAAAAAKTAAEAAAAAAAGAPKPADDPRVAALQEALRISEEARRTATAAAPAPIAEPPAPKLTREQLAELFQKDPLAAVEHMQAEALRVAEENLDKRIKPLLAGTAGSAEQMARAKYREEFEILGPEIDRFVAGLPDRSVLSSPKAWDDMIFWMRGQPGNLEKIIERRSKTKADEATAVAQAAQAAAAGPTIRSDTRAAAPSANGALDTTEKEIAKALNMTDADYITWRRMGQ